MSVRAVVMPADAVKQFVPSEVQQRRVADDISSAAMKYNHGAVTIGQWNNGRIEESETGPSIVADGFVHSVSQVPAEQKEMQRHLHSIIQENKLKTCSVGIDFYQNVPRLFEVSLVDTPRFPGSTVELRASEDGGMRVRVHGELKGDSAPSDISSSSESYREQFSNFLNTSLGKIPKTASSQFQAPAMEAEPTSSQTAPPLAEPPKDNNAPEAADVEAPEAKKTKLEKKEPSFSYDKAGNLVTSDTRSLDERLGLTAEKKDVLGEETVAMMRNTLIEQDKKTSSELEALRHERDALLMDRRRTEQEYAAAQAPRAKMVLTGFEKVGQKADEITAAVSTLSGAKQHSVFWDALATNQKAFDQTKMQYADLIESHKRLQAEMDGLREQTAKQARVTQLQQTAQRSTPATMTTGMTSAVEAALHQQMTPTTQLRASATGSTYDFNFNPFTPQNGAAVAALSPYGESFSQIMRPAVAKTQI